MTSILPISAVRATLPDLVSKVGEGILRVTITVKGKPKAMLISAEELESIEETAEILSIPGIKKSIAAGMRAAKKGQGIPLSQLKSKK